MRLEDINFLRQPQGHVTNTTDVQKLHYTALHCIAHHTTLHYISYLDRFDDPWREGSGQQGAARYDLEQATL